MKLCEYELNLATALFTLSLTKFPIEQVSTGTDTYYNNIYAEYTPSNYEITTYFKVYWRYIRYNSLYISRTINPDERYRPVIDIFLLEIYNFSNIYINFR